MRYWLLTGAVDAYHIEPNTRAVPGLAQTRPVSHPKRSLGSLLTSTSKSAMVDMTSSISRPFTVPKTTNGGSSASNAIVVDDDDAQSWQNAKQQFVVKMEPHAAVPTVEGVCVQRSAADFPAVARKVLEPSDVPKLYSFIRQLQTGEDVESSLSGICNLLRDPACKELLELLPQVLSGAMCEQFIETARTRGLSVCDTGAQRSVAGVHSSDMSTLFKRLQQKKRKTQQGNVPTAAVVKDPQCFVCYDIARKAYASSQCGHICCQSCWKKVMGDSVDSCCCELMMLCATLIHADGEGRIYILPSVQGPHQTKRAELDPGSKKLLGSRCLC